jgi:hypothetical protein
MSEELLITIVGRVALPDGLFAQARRIAEVETSINALRAAAGSVDGIDFQVDASLVPAGAEPEPAPSAQPETAAQAETRRRRRTKEEMAAARAAEAAGQTPASTAEQPVPQVEQQIDLEDAIAATPAAAVVGTAAPSQSAAAVAVTAPTVEQPGRVAPPWAKKPEPAPTAAQPTPVAQSVLPTAPAAQNAGDRIPVHAAGGTVFTTFKSVENAAEKMIELVNACETCVALDGLMAANEHVTDWPQALRVSIYNAAGDRDNALRAAGMTGE